ncbi:MAG: protein phosphatase 2C domain-containing protein [gamma proteobacterium symbiont of Bathyaustriella thionipta]|nr:protein phosphatase 2C domain-containing protein [gamma proteobacterium symbiont of Bathyaustriella thionipta]MCU7948934.1 protein phosphatase 2C domain-containing protein [gamma proteobacterium symbiont of Bathyaustriella thionipta]MCU7953791.1 protein phosphatase 2C domain-containing protein [gamma proteobacterium symbiont of Bathyaustriella thionipta]MCU7955465.1 protein phosphatase 2C domain-containing protein [gamma proteobacterium symbiont of Bathyaustriella thionipta]MCU7966418.1 prot
MLKHFLSIKCIGYGNTDTGRSREHNEDNIRLNQDNTVFILADGMGGHQAGEVASKMAADMIENALINHSSSKATSSDVEFSELSTVTSAIEAANLKISQTNNDRGLRKGKGMGTTIVGCWYLPDKKMSVIFHVGDSRAYSYFKQELTQLTTDHSLLQLWKDKCFDGDKPAANVLTKALGPYPEVAPDVSLYPARKGEKILLCSDGLNTMVSDEKIFDILIHHENSAETAIEQLIIEANQAGGEDNISVILIKL